MTFRATGWSDCRKRVLFIWQWPVSVERKARGNVVWAQFSDQPCASRRCRHNRRDQHIDHPAVVHVIYQWLTPAPRIIIERPAVYGRIGRSRAMVSICQRGTPVISRPGRSIRFDFSVIAALFHLQPRSKAAIRQYQIISADDRTGVAISCQILTGSGAPGRIILRGEDARFFQYRQSKVRLASC